MAKPIPVVQTRLKLLFRESWNNLIGESLLPDLISFTYEEKESGEADEISITLKDETGKWAGTWKPQGGEHVSAFILQGNVDKAENTLPCGKFYVDELSTSGGSSGRTFTMKAVSIPLDKPCRRKMKSKGWEKANLQSIAGEIAYESEMSLFWDCEENPQYVRIDQKAESDLKFLSRLCEEAGLSLKVTEDTIVIFDKKRYESKKPKKTFTLGKSDIIDWNFESTQSETYKSCKVQWTNPETHQSHESTFVDENVDDNGQEYVFKCSVKGVPFTQAADWAKAKLRELNSRKVTGSMTLPGDVTMYSGDVIACKGFGSFDGNFIVEKACHSVQNGYTTAIELRRTNSDY